jgi:hypothetical protein
MSERRGFGNVDRRHSNGNEMTEEFDARLSNFACNGPSEMLHVTAGSAFPPERAKFRGFANSVSGVLTSVN